MNPLRFLHDRFAYLSAGLLEEMAKVSVFKTFDAQTELVREGQYIKVVPLVFSGLVKVFTRMEDKELLLYYIKPEQSCIMSFSSAINHDKSRITAITEESTQALLMPSDEVAKWVQSFPAINQLFYQQYDLRYSELIDTIHHLLYFKLDKRLIDYLQGKIQVTGKNPVKISHKEIAADLGTAREVISRLLKRFEKENLVRQHPGAVELLPGL